VTVEVDGGPTRTVVVNFSLTGSITVRDNGAVADDAFQVILDGKVVGQTTVGGTNEFSVRNLQPGTHTLTVIAVVAPDNIGTYEVSVRNGLTFSGGGTVRSGRLPQGGATTFNVLVP